MMSILTDAERDERKESFAVSLTGWNGRPRLEVSKGQHGTILDISESLGASVSAISSQGTVVKITDAMLILILFSGLYLAEFPKAEYIRLLSQLNSC